MIVGNRRRLAETKFDVVVMVGSMCAGKSTIGHAIAAEMSSRAEVVRRVSTRPPRNGDDEVTTVSWDHFEQQVQTGRFALSWVRPVAGGEPIGYGCLGAPPGVVPIFVAGHGVYTNAASVRPVDALRRALLVGVLAPADVRRGRLLRRSPDVLAEGAQRVAALMAHDDKAMLRHVDIAVDNASDDSTPTAPTASGNVTAVARVIAHLLNSD